MKKFLLLTLICTILLVGTVSALDFGFNNKKFIEEDEYGSIEIKNWWGLGTKVAEYSLEKNTDYCLVNCYAEGTVNLYKKEKLFSDLRFKGRDNNFRDLKDYGISYGFNETYNEEVNDYSYENITTENGTIQERILIGSHNEIRTRFVWKNYDGENLDAGTYKWKISAKKKSGEDLDWIISAFGKEFEEWAWWNNSWNFKRLETVNFSGNISLSNYWVRVDSWEAPSGKTASDMSDIRIVNLNEDTELVWKYTSKNSTHMDLWIFAEEGIEEVTFSVFQYYVYYNTTDPVDYGWNNTFYYGDTFTNQTSHTWDEDQSGGTIYMENDYIYFNDVGGGGDGVLYQALPTEVANWTGYTIDFNTTWTGCQTNDGSYMYGGLTQDGVNPTDTWVGFFTNGRYSGYPNTHLNNAWGSTVVGAGIDIGVNICNNIISGKVVQISNSNASSVARTQTMIWDRDQVSNGVLTETTASYQMANTPALRWQNAGRWAGNDAKLFYLLISKGNGTQSGYLVGSEINASFEPEIILNSPIDYYNSTSQSIIFNGTVQDLDSGIDNVTLIIDDTYNETNSSGINGTDYIFSKIIADGDHTWTFEACDNTSQCTNTSFRTLTIDTIYPVISISYPNETFDYFEINNNLSLNWSVNDTNLDSCWYDWNGVNVTITCLDNQTYINITEGSAKELTLYANDTLGHLSSYTTTWDYLSFFNSFTYNPLTYETAYETYLVQILSKSGITPSNGRFNYGGTEYVATITAAAGDNYNISGRSQDIPTVGAITNNSINFTWTSDSTQINTSNYIQTTHPISLSMTSTSCSAGSLNYLNFTFKDEESDADLNASNDLTDVDYWLGTGTVTKSLITSNITDNDYYVFCSNPQNRTLTLDMVFKYSKSGYPIRTFAYDDVDFTNSTTNQTLYLLATADGIYSSINIIDSVGNPIQGVTITIERQFAGVWTVIGQDTTGSDGSATFWVNPNFQHRITAEAEGYITGVVTITPTQSTYTMTLASSAEAGGYISELPGLKWVVLPAIGKISPGSTNFNATVTSTQSNLENCKLELLNSTNSSQVLATTTDITNSSYCYLTITYPATEDNNLFGRLSIDTTNTTGFVVVDSDWKWIVQDIENKEWRSIGSFFGDLKTIGEFGEGNEAEFSRIVFFFILITIFVGVFNYFTGVEFTNPGISLIVIWVIVLVASSAEFLSFDSGSSNVNERVEQWGFFFILTLMIGGFLLSTMRRAQE